MRFARGRLTAAATAAVAAAGLAGTAVPAHADPGHRGTLLASAPLHTAAALPSASFTRAIRYVSEGVGGRRIAVTGTVAVPKGKAPRGGWPVLSWAHGTTGTADACAPSRDTATGPAHDYLSITEGYLDKWVARGFAVVQTDYEGMGTPGGHPYMNGASEANTVIDIVRAAHGVDPHIGRTFYVAGHSQGGHATLFTAAEKTRDVRLKGAVAIAPGSHMAETATYVQAQYPGAELAVPFLFVLLNGAKAANPSFHPEDLLTPAAAKVLESGQRDACLAQLREAGSAIPLDQVFRPDADLTAFETYFNAQEATGLDLRVPTLVAQGTADTSVSPAATKALVADLCKRSPAIAYREYAGADHRASINASFDDALAFVRTLQSGGTPPTTC
ncbi:alpha/beta hydrolase family protein [Actinomadura montaniterrae]|uniref:Alpha/beta fold hydrolase n=1 Tax=Actinomadura montaniterrae TaxID=1803903 RepID=A0A6L3W1M2_9ACTN|nr:alpha/beta hydrolase [Actinomadura montaniterrae]KAB2383620.1 alpha/beta fold hydrolase [Actinomadura montaniterrae]